LSPDAVYDEMATNRRIQGSENIIEALQGWASAFPDAKATFVRDLVTGDTAVFQLVWTGTGTLQTPSGPIPASNRVVELPACSVIQVEGEKIKNDTHYFDLLTQIGAAGATSARPRSITLRSERALLGGLSCATRENGGGRGDDRAMKRETDPTCWRGS
jgi:steroid delta-isomerase-like uncharacterized protein